MTFDRLFEVEIYHSLYTKDVFYLMTQIDMNILSFLQS